jgi:hypothetical protein
MNLAAIEDDWHAHLVAAGLRERFGVEIGDTLRLTLESSMRAYVIFDVPRSE